jgi:hypothetical protein
VRGELHLHCVDYDTSDTVSLELGAIRETVETVAEVKNVLATRINSGYYRQV